MKEKLKNKKLRLKRSSTTGEPSSFDLTEDDFHLVRKNTEYNIPESKVLK